MSNVTAASGLLKEHWCVGNVEARIRQASRDLRWPFSRVWNLWYGKVRRIDAHEWEQLRAVVRQEQEETALEHDEITSRLARLEAMVVALLAAQDRSALAGESSAARCEVEVLAGASGADGARAVGANVRLRGER